MTTGTGIGYFLYMVNLNLVDSLPT